MLRFQTLLRPSLFIIQSNTISTNLRNDVAVRHLDDLPTAKKFLGIVDLELIRQPMPKLHEFWRKRANQLGDIYTFQPFFFSPKILIISKPSLIAELCAKEGEMPERRSMGFLCKRAREIAGLKEGVGFASGAEWKRARDPLSKRLLRPKFLSGYFPKLSEIAQIAVTDIIDLQRTEQNKFAPIIDRLRLWTFNSADYLAFHKFPDTGMTKELSEFIQAMISIMQSFIESEMRLSLPPYFEQKKLRKLVKSAQIGIAYIRKQIEISNTLPKDPDVEHITLLEYLQTQTDFNEYEIIDTFLSLLGAGVDTTIKSTQWLWYNLSKNVSVQDKLCEELHSVIGDSSFITAEHYNKLHYLKMCMKEAMRVTPTTAAFTRTLREENTISGVTIPKNTQVVADLYGIGLDERYWRDPLEFVPERWENRKEIDPFSYIPFGIGPRMCVGRRIAESQMMLITAHLCRSYRIHLVQEPDPKFELLLTPEGLNLSFEKR